MKRLKAMHSTAMTIIEKHMGKGTSRTSRPLSFQISPGRLKKVNLCTFRKDARVIMLTNTARIEKAVGLGSANAMIVKTNQVGTLSDSRRAVEKAQSSGYVTVMSHRSGEVSTGELAQIAVGLSCPVIKCGVIGGERISKLNELIRIEEDAEKRKLLAGMAKIPG